MPPKQQYPTPSTVYDGVHHTPMARFSMLATSTVGIVPVPKRSAPETSRLEFFEDVSFGIGNRLGCREIELGKRPTGVCDTPSYTASASLAPLPHPEHVEGEEDEALRAAPRLIAVLPRHSRLGHDPAHSSV